MDNTWALIFSDFDHFRGQFWSKKWSKSGQKVVKKVVTGKSCEKFGQFWTKKVGKWPFLKMKVARRFA